MLSKKNISQISNQVVTYPQTVAGRNFNTHLDQLKIIEMKPSPHFFQSSINILAAISILFRMIVAIAKRSFRRTLIFFLLSQRVFPCPSTNLREGFLISSLFSNYHKTSPISHILSSIIFLFYFFIFDRFETYYED